MEREREREREKKKKKKGSVLFACLVDDDDYYDDDLWNFAELWHQIYGALSEPRTHR